MSYQGIIRHCLISSPSDIPDRDLLIVHREIVRWNGAYGSTFRTSITPINWNINAAPEYGRPPQDVIDDQLVDACDMGIALFATRLGTPTRDSVSGTAKEIERLSEAGRPVGVLRSRRPVDPGSIDPAQHQRLDEYLDKISKNGLLMDYSDDAELAAQVQNFLRTVVARDEGITVDELEETRVADVWPSTDVEQRPSPSGSTYRNDYLVVTNHGTAPAYNVFVSFEPVGEDEVAWGISGDDLSMDKPNVESLAPYGGHVRLPLSTAMNTAAQVRCIVTFTDDRGEWSNLATLRLT